MIYQQLDNGCHVAVRRNGNSKLAAIQVWVHAGSIHESERQYGMAHLIEHMLFKGTNKRGVGQISREVEACGGDINAYTTFDRTVYYLTLDIEDLEQGIDILSDAVFNSQFDAEELEREKEVVVEEIRRGLDSPGNKVGRKLFEHAYGDGPVGRPIIGYEDGVKSFSRQDVLDFYQRWYQPENMDVVVVGDFQEDKTFSLVEKYFAAASNDFLGRIGQPKDAFAVESKVEILKADYKQPRLQLAFAGTDVNHRDAIYLDLASFVLGVGELSRLNTRVRDEKQFVTAIGSSLYAPSFRGLFTVSAFPVADRYLEAVGEIAQTLVDFVREAPITPEELDRAKAHLKMQRILEEETVEGIARNIGFSLTTDQSLHFDDYYYDIIDRTTCEDVMATIWRHLKQERFVLVGMLPDDSLVEESQVKAAFADRFKLKKQPTFLRRLDGESDRSESGGDIVVREIKPGIKLAYKQRKQSQLLSMSLAAEGGTRGEVTENSGLYHCISNLVARSTHSAPHPKFSQAIENLGASIDGFSGKDSFGIQLQGLIEHRSQLFSNLAEALLDADFTEMHWEMTRQQIEQTLAAENDQPSSIAIRELKKRVYGQHPYSRPAYGSLQSVTQFDAKTLLARFNELRDQGPWVVGAVSSLPVDEFALELQSCLAGWNPCAEKNVFATADRCQHELPAADTVKIDKDREQTHIVLGFKGLTWADQDRESLDVLSSILGGMGGRLFMRLRDRNSLAYSVAPMTAHGYHAGIFGCYIACAPDKTEQALTQLEEELDRLLESPCSDEELQRAKRYIVGSHESEYQQSDSQAMTMGLMELFGLGADDYLRYRERMQRVDAKRVQAVARRLFVKENLVKVIVGKPF